ncbi:MAG: phosphocholine cytidylyltransferase family protein [Rhodobacter sp.]|nr:phosphocholine cytidylyltransferase family protein [Rhodobacter sp.]
MAEITAIVLAAGLGVRMGPRGKLMPKGLLQVGGATLIEQSVAALRSWGAARIRIVTGHLSDQFEAAFAGTDVELCHNPHYATTGNLWSLAVGLEGAEGPCLILEGDLIYAPQVLDAVDGTSNRFLVSTPTGAGDEEYVWAAGVQGGPLHMLDVSKDIRRRAEPPLGEMIGVTELTAQAVARMRRVALDVMAQNPEEHYEPGLVALSREDAIECVLLEGVPWAEIDDERMLERAERVVFPKIQAWRARHRGSGAPAA